MKGLIPNENHVMWPVQAAQGFFLSRDTYFFLLLVFAFESTLQDLEEKSQVFPYPNSFGAFFLCVGSRIDYRCSCGHTHARIYFGRKSRINSKMAFDARVSVQNVLPLNARPTLTSLSCYDVILQQIKVESYRGRPSRHVWKELLAQFFLPWVSLCSHSGQD